MGANEDNTDAYLMLMAEGLAKKELEDAETKSLHEKIHAMVVDLNDEGYIQVRIPGVHSVNTPINELPWVSIRNPSFANSGVGEKFSINKNQWVMLEDVSGGVGMAYEAVSGSNIKDTEKDSDQKFDYSKSKTSNDTTDESTTDSGTSTGAGNLTGSNSENNKPYDWDIEKNKSLSKESFPKIFSGIFEKLKNTLHALIQMKLLKILMGSPGGPSEPEPPQNGWDVKTQFIDFSTTPEKLVDKYGKNLGNLSDFIFNEMNINNSTTLIKIKPEEYNIELLNPEKIVGFDDGEKIYASIENWELIIPPNVYYYDPDTGVPPECVDYECDPIYCIGPDDRSCCKDYTIEYKITPKNPKGPYQEYIDLIKIRVCKQFIQDTDEENPINNNYNYKRNYSYFNTSLKILNSDVLLYSNGNAITPQYELNEHESDSINGKARNKSGFQLANGMSFEYDSSNDNAYMSFKHPSGSRLDMHHAGNFTLKSNNNLQIISESKAHIFANGSFNLASPTFISTKSPNFYHEGKLVIDGDVLISGDVIIQGDLEVQGNVKIGGTCEAQDFIPTGKGYTLNQHHHDGNPLICPLPC